MKALCLSRFRMPQAKTGLRKICKASALIRHHHGASIVNNKGVFLSLYRLGNVSVRKFEESRRGTFTVHLSPLQAGGYHR